MNVREALEKLLPECDIVGELTIENGQTYVDVSINKVAGALAPKIEAARRAAHDAGFDAEVTSLRNHDNGITAGIEAMQ